MHALIAAILPVPPVSGVGWRSSLYPENWQPGHMDSQGRFLHDFSYAGYHRGEVAIPDVDEKIINVAQKPYHADPSGKKDSTRAIQAALDHAARTGGGVVFMPAGTYRVRIDEGKTSVLDIRGSKTILRGGGADKTFLFLDGCKMRGKTIIDIRSTEIKAWPEKAPISARDAKRGMIASPMSKDIHLPAKILPVEDASLFNAGDDVLARIDLTQRFIDEHGMTGEWLPEEAGFRIVAFCRTIMAVDKERNTLTVDIPTRYPMLMADNARVEKLRGRLVSEVGLEDFSIGMRQHPGSGLNELDHLNAGTVGYDASASCAILVENAENCWIRRVNSYRPPVNNDNIHTLSNGIRLRRCRLVTIEDCKWGFPQYRGGSGDGYPYYMMGQDCLIQNCLAEAGRHNYSFGSAQCSGNVVFDCLAKDGLLASDFHMWLSPANLIDGVTCDRDYFEAKFRPWGKWGGNPLHGITTTQSVFWNLKGERYGEPVFVFHEYGERKRPQVLVQSAQYGTGYIIGTRGPACEVDAGENEFVEGAGMGDSLAPRSLYLDQRRRRLGR
ncbi:MAG: glycoside hydrolase family 55 protein [Opitutaceae bacterium]|jgi:hypothetical protein|nr:glycoside hydrolase family 55 protein [Opitutaceae bacterium]